ncbi:hypothetical protein KF913_07720 [Candidatus Obscuribacterales bacterium]|nr:hypothetical protein [Candidatus Obscuribacterales bacterium]
MQELDDQMRYVALLDVLGFKSALGTLGVKKLSYIYKSCLKQIEEEHKAEYPTKTITSVIDLKTGIEKLVAEREGVYQAFRYLEQPVVFSDSILIFSKDVTQNSLIEISNFSNLVFQSFLDKGLPIRGVISQGNCVVEETISLYVGDAIVRAVELEKTLDVIGVIVDESVDNSINFDHELLDIQLKCGHKERYRVPRYNPESATRGPYVMWAKFDECREAAPSSLKARYANSEEILSVMVDGKPTGYRDYHERLEEGRLLQEQGLLDEDS